MAPNRKHDLKGPKRSAGARTKPAETRREELLEAAVSLFLAKGVSAATIDEIAAGAHVAKGTFYLYFNSKEDVVAVLRERFIGGFRSKGQESVDAVPEGDWHSKLRAWVRAGVDAYLEQSRLHDIVFHDYRPDQRRMKDDNPVISDFAALLEAGASAGAWSAEDIRLTAIVLFQGLHGAVDSAILAGKRDGAELAEKLSALFLKSLRP